MKPSTTTILNIEYNKFVEQIQEQLKAISANISQVPDKLNYAHLGNLIHVSEDLHSITNFLNITQGE